MPEVGITLDAGVPALVSTPALDLTPDDVALPRVHIAQFMSKAVQDDLVEKGEIYSSTSQEDPDPIVMEQPVRFYVLGLKKGKSFSEDGELQRYDFNDPDAPAGAWVTYDYTLAMPEYDASVPFKMLLTKTGTPAARQINTVLLRASQPSYELCFTLETAAKENPKGKYWVARVRLVDSDKNEIKIATELATMLSSQPDMGSGNDTPDI